METWKAQVVSLYIIIRLSCRWVYEKDGMFRAELEGEDGVVKGVYTVEDQQGNVETQAYISGGQQGGHRWAALPQ